MYPTSSRSSTGTFDDQFGLCKTGAETAATIILLIFAAVLGFILASITFGLQIPAGIILPFMAIGALTGRAVGILMEIWQHKYPCFIAFQSCEPDVPCVTPGTYAIIGAAATLAGVTRMTVSIVVIMFELTGALTYVLPIMVAVMLSKWVGDAFSRRGIYESWIHFNEYPFLDNSEEMIIPDIPASQIMTRIEDLVVLTATGHTIASLETILNTHPYRGFPAVSDPRDAVLLGYISRAELAYNLDVARRPLRSLPPETEAFFRTSRSPIRGRLSISVHGWTIRPHTTEPQQPPPCSQLLPEAGTAIRALQRPRHPTGPADQEGRLVCPERSRRDQADDFWRPRPWSRDGDYTRGWRGRAERSLG